MMEQENKRLQETTEEEETSFLSRITEFFVKLMDKFTKGKYSTPEEQAFFADEKNLYDENGRLTPQYQKKIKEYEEYVKSKDVDGFLHEVHREDSEEFGPAYNENEMTIIESASGFISDQERIMKELENARMNAIRNKEIFDFDKWFAEYAESHNLGEEERKKALEYILETIDDVDNSEESIGENDISSKTFVGRVIDETK